MSRDFFSLAWTRAIEVQTLPSLSYLLIAVTPFHITDKKESWCDAIGGSRGKKNEWRSFDFISHQLMCVIAEKEWTNRGYRGKNYFIKLFIKRYALTRAIFQRAMNLMTLRSPLLWKCHLIISRKNFITWHAMTSDRGHRQQGHNGIDHVLVESDSLPSDLSIDRIDASVNRTKTR